MRTKNWSESVFTGITGLTRNVQNTRRSTIYISVKRNSLHTHDITVIYDIFMPHYKKRIACNNSATRMWQLSENCTTGQVMITIRSTHSV